MNDIGQFSHSSGWHPSFLGSPIWGALGQWQGFEC